VSSLTEEANVEADVVHVLVVKVKDVNEGRVRAAAQRLEEEQKLSPRPAESVFRLRCVDRPGDDGSIVVHLRASQNPTQTRMRREAPDEKSDGRQQNARRAEANKQDNETGSHRQCIERRFLLLVQHAIAALDGA
jgi:hypothetical protein